MRVRLSLAAAASMLAAGPPAAAAIIINVGAAAVQPDERLSFINASLPALVIQGVTDETDTLFTVTGGENLVGAGGSTGRLDTVDGRISTAFTFNGRANQLVGFDVSDPGFAFTETEFRIFGGTATQATLTFVDTAGEVFQQTFAIPASGFVNAIAIDGQLIDYFSIAANGTINDLRTIRVGGIQAIPAVVPEPAAWAIMIMGFGGVGALMRRRRTVGAAA